MKKGTLSTIAVVLVIVGGLNWGLVGLLEWNLVEAIFGISTVITKIIYDLVGLSAIYMVYTSMSKGE
ncbi:DUF378 domain-containing protein [Candidatus Berkelbacteria bacterium CG_4_9_14_3_um_filter_39_23]|uniref:DUF378 domain-containing protein n=2 Tax=Candidatus Berkelbacteria TaxID=1618330 RepID=A0A2M8C4C9_9BACT|nr:DUF378 domain-containing protein [Candidatus Berkelbacteria bacterium]OIP04752.1 MAG: DUF378 domain-containing protein [Candidatus Berkelbacteria bacterium CG2_30_39_44]PIR27911.1 MAG: DUF378 domain-containing protein [Candidatus Berkelbacteria bacterium CG11_big_fil_rev_8_21_14_0_20_40_23]PJB50947.1 MAG: DUF378 domain-containing protein [Candidatus Berkelbacteria bacterium CG_4_9_14_3_um_filter_39_23]